MIERKGWEVDGAVSESEEDQKQELLASGAEIARDIQRLVRNSSLSIRTDFQYGIRPFQAEPGDESFPWEMVLLFRVTDLGLVRLEDLEKFIEGSLLSFLQKTKPRIVWRVKVG